MRVRLVGAVLAGVLLTAGCSTGDSPSTRTSPSPSVVVSSAPAPPAAPADGSCHRLSLAAATTPVDESKPVPCRQPHTSRTYHVGTITAVADGHLLAADSRTVRARVAQRCERAFVGYVGGDRTARRLSRLQPVWFTPSLEQSDDGADWFRCDVVALRSEGRLLPLPPRMKGVLDRRAGQDRFGTCSTTAPDRKGFQRVACSVRHSWRAVDDVPIPGGVRYLGKRGSAAGNAACKALAEDRAGGALKYSWSFEWPTRQQWREGQRYGLCWLPDRG